MGIDFSKFSKDFQTQYAAATSETSDGGKKITQKEYESFTKEDQKKLSELLSGGSKNNSDGLINVAHSQDGKGAAIAFNSDKKENEGLLTLTKDTIKAYPNAARGYLHNGVATLYDKNGNPVKDENGKVVSFNFNKPSNSSSGLAQWYMNHNSGKFDIETLNAFQNLDKTIDGSKETDKDIYQLMTENRLEDLKNASEDEKKGFFDKLDATAAYKKAQSKEMLKQAEQMLYEASESGKLDKKASAFVNTLMSACQVADNEIGLTKFKEFMYGATGITAGADALTKAVDDGNDKNLSKGEKAVELLKGAGRGLDSFVGTQGLAFMGALAGAGEAASVAGVGEAFSLLTTAYFTYDGVNTVVDGIKGAVNAQTKEDAHAAGEQIGSGAFMMAGGAKFFGKAGKQVYDNHVKTKTSANDGVTGERNYPSLSEVDKHTRDDRINQANLSPAAFDKVSNKKAQKQVGTYLDRLLEMVPKDAPEVNIGDVKKYADFMLPDGTVISRNHAGDTGKVEFNTKTGKYEVRDIDNAILFRIRDINGTEHVLPALSSENVAKAKKILGYMSTLHEIPREQIADVQNAKLSTLKVKQQQTAKPKEPLPTAQELQYAQEYIAQHKDDVIITHTHFNKKGDKVVKIVTVDEKSAKVMHEIANQLHKIGQSIEDGIVSYMEESGFGTIDGVQKMTHRPKSVQSLYDKLVNYAKDHPDNTTMSKAIGDIRDIVGTRTAILSGDFTKNPEVAALMKAGKMKEAIARAAELQSEPILQKLEGQIDQMQKEGFKGNVMSRISNYMGNNGIPYLSERQLARLQQHALKRGLVLKYAVRSDKNPTEKYATKVRDSGYTALQINFKMPDNRVFEWQFRGDKVNVFAEAEHVPYDLRTGKDIIAAHPELKELYEPIKELLSEKNMGDTKFNKYNEYLTAHYEYLRLQELGFDAEPPKLSDYGNYDIKLRADNLELLDKYAGKIKDHPENSNEIIAEYNRLVNSSK